MKFTDLPSPAQLLAVAIATAANANGDSRERATKAAWEFLSMIDVDSVVWVPDPKPLPKPERLW